MLLAVLRPRSTSQNSVEDAERCCSSEQPQYPLKTPSSLQRTAPAAATSVVAAPAVRARIAHVAPPPAPMEAIIDKMQDENSGVPVRTVKSFMSKIPSVFTGSDLVAWLTRHFRLEETWEALHLAHLLAAHGYLFPIDDHCLTVKNDNTYYRFQTPYFWPSNQWEPENTDYDKLDCECGLSYIGQTKRSIKTRVKEHIADMKHTRSTKSAISEHKLDKPNHYIRFDNPQILAKENLQFYTRDKIMNKTKLPGCVNTTELDPRKLSRINALKARRRRQCQELIMQHNLKNNPIVTITNPQESEEEIQKKNAENSIKENGESSQPQITISCPETIPKDQLSVEQQIEAARRQVAMLKARIERRNIRGSKVAEMFIAYCEQYAEYDAFLTPPEWPNPWINDTTELWEQEKQCKDPLPLRRVRRWSFGLRELLQDPAGKDHFAKFLSKEFSGENLKFWLAVQELKALPIRRVSARAKDIWKEFLASDAPSPINIDAASRELTRSKVESGTPDRYCFDQAQAHVYHLMKSDSYSRYLRSEMYKDYLNGSKKKTSVKGIRSIVSFTGRKETN
ncbi:hypothetical protein K1T71_014769 [Dendrolimus kikuchii]|nr:hypothetical protein K1T71_014769 [Dendrolimus kikuchii]